MTKRRKDHFKLYFYIYIYIYIYIYVYVYTKIISPKDLNITMMIEQSL